MCKDGSRTERHGWLISNIAMFIQCVCPVCQASNPGTGSSENEKLKVKVEVRASFVLWKMFKSNSSNSADNEEM